MSVRMRLFISALVVAAASCLVQADETVEFPVMSVTEGAGLELNTTVAWPNSGCCCGGKARTCSTTVYSSACSTLQQYTSTTAIQCASKGGWSFNAVSALGGLSFMFEGPCANTNCVNMTCAGGRLTGAMFNMLQEGNGLNIYSKCMPQVLAPVTNMMCYVLLGSVAPPEVLEALRPEAEAAQAKLDMWRLRSPSPPALRGAPSEPEP